MKIQFIKNLTLVLVSLFCAVIVIEFSSYFLLIKSDNSSIQVKSSLLKEGNFPAQLYLNDKNVYEVFRGFLVRTNHAKVSILIDDNKIFRSKECIEWYDGNNIHHVRWMDGIDNSYLKKKYSNYEVKSYENYDEFLKSLKELSKNKKIIVTLGGSTSAWAVNWPFYFAKKLDLKKYTVVNLAEPGGMTADHIKIINFFVSKMENVLGRKPYMVVGLDGFNDMYTGDFYDLAQKKRVDIISGAAIYLEYLRQDNSTKVENNNSNKSSIWSSFLRLFQNNSLKYVLVRTFPYTIALLTDDNLANKVDVISEEGDDRKFIVIPDNIQNEIVNNFKQNLVKIDNSLSNEGILFYSYLQPIALKKYYPFLKSWWKENIDPKKSWAATPLNYDIETDVNYTLKSMSRGGRFGIPYIIYENGFYSKAESMFLELDRELGKGRFVNLSMVFKDVNEGVYMGDAVHYIETGSSIIGNTIFEDLARKGVIK